MTPEQYEAVCRKTCDKAYTLLPTIDMLGWCGGSQGWLPYFHWEKNQDIIVALIAFASARSVAERERIRKKIVDTFYGGEEAYKEFCKLRLSSIKLL